jgi:di/tricarboxylate transporter
MGISRQMRIPAGRLLMPLAYGVIAGGMATLFTTSNIITSSALRQAGLQPFGVLDFLPVGLPLVVIATLYMLLIGRHLLPKVEAQGIIPTRPPRGRVDLLAAYRMQESLWEVTVLRGSAMAGLTILEGEWRNKVRLNVLSILRKRKLICSPPSGMPIREGDVIFAQGEPNQETLRAYGLRLEEKKPLIIQANGSPDAVAEIVLAPHSQLAGKTLREIHFREKWNLTVLALWRAGKPIHTGFASMPLQVGDGLLIQGTVNNLRILRQDRDFIILEEDADAVARPHKAAWATLIGLATLAVAITGWLPISLVSLAGAVAMILAGCLGMDEAYHAIDWKSIFLIAGLWPLSMAIQTSGLSGILVNGLLDAAEHVSPPVLVALLLFTTMALANAMTGQAAAPIILAPIGLTIAAATGSDPRMFLMAIALGCSLVFPSPIGHPVNIIAMGSGGYTFKDFFRVGWLLTILLFPAILLGLHWFWGLW